MRGRSIPNIHIEQPRKDLRRSNIEAWLKPGSDWSPSKVGNAATQLLDAFDVFSFVQDVAGAGQSDVSNLSYPTVLARRST